jgi:hypothetical protein
MAEEIQLLTCGYSARCTVCGCRARATMLARYTDGQGRPLKQRELCDRHAAWLKANRLNVHAVRREAQGTPCDPKESVSYAKTRKRACHRGRH